MSKVWVNIGLSLDGYMAQYVWPSSTGARSWPQEVPFHTHLRYVRQ